LQSFGDLLRFDFITVVQASPAEQF